MTGGHFVSVLRTDQSFVEAVVRQDVDFRAVLRTDESLPFVSVFGTDQSFVGHKKVVARHVAGPPFPLLLLGVCNGASHKPTVENVSENPL